MTRSVTPLRVSQRPNHGKVAPRPRAQCRSSSLYTRGIYRLGAPHLSNEHGPGGVYIEDFREGSV